MQTVNLLPYIFLFLANDMFNPALFASQRTCTHSFSLVNEMGIFTKSHSSSAVCFSPSYFSFLSFLFHLPFLYLHTLSISPYSSFFCFYLSLIYNCHCLLFILNDSESLLSQFGLESRVKLIILIISLIIPSYHFSTRSVNCYTWKQTWRQSHA